MSETKNQDLEPFDQPGGKFYCWKVVSTRTDLPKEKIPHYVWNVLTKTSDVPETPKDTKAVYLGRRNWAEGWFAHKTLDVGQTNDEVLSSFASYVDWVRSLPTNEFGVIEIRSVGSLMGAEDLWRWSGEEPGDRNPPCRCKHCKERGVIIISH